MALNVLMSTFNRVWVNFADILRSQKFKGLNVNISVGSSAKFYYDSACTSSIQSQGHALKTVLASFVRSSINE